MQIAHELGLKLTELDLFVKYLINDVELLKVEENKLTTNELQLILKKVTDERLKAKQRWCNSSNKSSEKGKNKKNFGEVLGTSPEVGKTSPEVLTSSPEVLMTSPEVYTNTHTHTQARARVYGLNNFKVPNRGQIKEFFSNAKNKVKPWDLEMEVEKYLTHRLARNKFEEVVDFMQDMANWNLNYKPTKKLEKLKKTKNTQVSGTDLADSILENSSKDWTFEIKNLNK